ncbi:hypothetical protein PsorP6_001991 [Peronosclerospora sorghi]|uniref:Uncharacterized protein n=1 Tax=Peronosclerospora sorghi TaxID=230839 RepID=A0ACC0WW09_9STRA|nr:hypothetical protein PsorP6_001991 [Peronosclerospora sorghi]
MKHTTTNPCALNHVRYSEPIGYFHLHQPVKVSSERSTTCTLSNPISSPSQKPAALGGWAKLSAQPWYGSTLTSLTQLQLRKRKVSRR